MLTIDTPFYQIKGVTIFRDDRDLDQFYYLPPAVRLAHQADGTLAFTLFKYRRDLIDNPALDPTKARGAGLALFETEMPLDHAGSLLSDLSSAADRPNARLDPVLFRSGKVHAIVAHSSDDKLVEDLVETSNAPIASPYHSAFALALSAEGATLFDRAARGGQIPAGVVYEMKFLALTPSLHARVRMNYDRIYDHFEASIGFTYYVSVKLDLDLEWLIEHDFVHIEITAFTDNADKDRQQELVMNLVKARIQSDFFRSAMPPQPDEGLAGPLAQTLQSILGTKVSSASAMFVLKAKFEMQSEKKDFELIFDGRTTVELTHVCSGFISGMTAGDSAPNIQEIDTHDPFFSALTVKIISTIDFSQLTDLREAALHITHGEQRESYVFNKSQNGPYQFQSALTNPDSDEIEYEMEYHFDPDAGSGPTTITAGLFKSRRRVLTVDPLEHFRYLRLNVKLGPVDTTVVPRIHVNLRVPGDPHQPDLARGTVDLDAQNQERTWRVRLPMTKNTDPLSIRASTQWEDAHGTTHDLDDEANVTGDSLVALGPYKDVLSIAVIPAAPWASVTQLRVELRYHDGDYQAQRSLLFDATHNASQTLQVPLLQPTLRKYEWRQVIVNNDGTANETDWTETDKALLVVGVVQKTSADVRVVWVGTPGNAFGLRVDFWVTPVSGDDQNVSIFLRAGQDSDKTATLPLDGDGRLQYRYEVRRLSPTGEEVLKSGTGNTGLLVAQ
ncbi:MAG TPA: hypothetical protein VKE93_07000 [Candidatus Angelobacter sp.]|nr:hypothetical protein [Candidatus Angelobacter sp.]